MNDAIVNALYASVIVLAVLGIAGLSRGLCTELFGERGLERRARHVADV